MAQEWHVWNWKLPVINLDLELQGIQAIVDELDPTAKQADAALKRTLNRMAKWLQTRTARGLSQELQMPQRVIRRRMKKSSITKSADGYSIRLFYGLNEVDLIYLGAKQTRKGVTAGKHKVDGAFIVKKKHQVFKRVSKSRFPIEKQSTPIKSQADAYLEGKAFNSVDFREQFFKTLEHELKWQMR